MPKTEDQTAAPPASEVPATEAERFAAMMERVHNRLAMLETSAADALTTAARLHSLEAEVALLRGEAQLRHQPRSLAPPITPGPQF